MSSMSKKMVNSAVALGCMLFAAPVMAHEALNEYVLDPMMVTAARYEKTETMTWNPFLPILSTALKLLRAALLFFTVLMQVPVLSILLLIKRQPRIKY